MKLLNYLSVFLLPFVLLYILLYGLWHRKPLFELFIKGGKDGISTVLSLAPTVIGLFVAIGILRSSGALDLLCRGLSPLSRLLNIPAELLPLSVLKLFSASGASALLFDLFKTYGTDSALGFAASLLLSCTETLFYTISVYLMSIRIQKSRWLIPAGLFIAFFSLFISSLLSRLIQ